MLGGAARMLVSALATAGQIIGLEIGISFAQTADPTATQSGQLMAVFLGVHGRRADLRDRAATTCSCTASPARTT